ncbi:MAG: hypothetical protein IPK46_00795 [Saprospiraceae bacterium]|nr:hypothetical protein [Saprospiraceae bacterium]
MTQVTGDSLDIYGNYSGKNIPVINNQMVVPVKNGFLWADLNTGATKESKMPFVMSPLRDLRLVSANNDLIFSATFTNTDLPTLFSVSNGVAEEMPFATNETGCISDARLYPLKNQLVLRDNHLYRVDEKETQLGPHKIIQFTEDGSMSMMANFIFCKKSTIGNTSSIPMEKKSTPFVSCPLSHPLLNSSKKSTTDFLLPWMMTYVNTIRILINSILFSKV